MGWKQKISRRTSNKNAVPPANGPAARQLRSCLKVQPLSSESKDERPSLSSGGESSRDHSTKSGRSLLSVFSGNSSRSKENTTEEIPRNNQSGDSVESASPSFTGRGSNQSASVASGSGGSGSTERPMERNVRFANVEIREHERAVGDNPSCSTGPPIAIGWGHSDTKIIKLDEYEEARPNRGRNRKIVLSREKREAILLDWGFAFEDIIDSIRGNIKVKNQRRQTVTNLGKVERIEEAFESASRKLKRALLLRRRTGDMVKELQEKAEVAAKTLKSIRIAEEDALNKIRENQAPEEVEPDGDQLEGLGNVSVADFCKKAPPETKLKRRASSFSSDFEESTCGFSLATSVSPSVLEMERFYHELELEMFGDVPLPDMVGETLEVPDLEIPEEERVYIDPPSVANFREPPSVTPSYAQRIHEQKEHHNSSYGSPERQQLQPKAMMISPVSLESKEVVSSNDGGHQDWRSRSPVDTQDRLSFDSEPGTPPFPLGPAPAGTCLYHNDPVMAIRMGKEIPQQVSASKSGEWKEEDRLRANMARAYLSHTVTEMEQTYLHPSLAPPPPPPNQFGMTFIPVGGPGARFPRGPVPGPYYHAGQGGYNKLSSRRKDGPEVRHIPPFTNLSPTHWMEGRDSGSQTLRPKYEPITISEESVYQPGRMSTIAMRYGPVPQSFKSS